MTIEGFIEIQLATVYLEANAVKESTIGKNQPVTAVLAETRADKSRVVNVTVEVVGGRDILIVADNEVFDLVGTAVGNSQVITLQADIETQGVKF